MAKNLRDRFKSTKIETIQEDIDREEKRKESLKSKGSKGDRIEEIKFEKKDEKRLRILPGKDEAPYYQQVMIHWVPFIKEVDDDDSGKKKKVRSNRPIFNAVINSGAKKDIIDEYIKIATGLINEKGIKDKSEYKKQFKYINGYNEGGKYTGGIKGKNSWNMYALDIDSDDPEEIVELAANTSIRKGMNDVAFDNADGTLGTEPFTDIESGIPITIKVDKTAEVADMYKVSMPRKEKEYPLSDEVLEKLVSIKSLEDRFVNTYGRRDFDLAVAGLELFDETSNYGVLDTPEWESALEEISSWYPEEDESEELKEEEEEVVEEEEVKKDFLDEMSREELEDYVEDKDLEIRITRRTKDDDIRSKIRELGEDLPFDVDEKSEEIVDEEEVEAPKRRRRSK